MNTARQLSCGKATIDSRVVFSISCRLTTGWRRLRCRARSQSGSRTWPRGLSGSRVARSRSAGSSGITSSQPCSAASPSRSRCCPARLPDRHRHAVWLSVSQFAPAATTVGLLCVAVGIVLRVGTVPALREPRPLWHLLVALGCAIIVRSCCSARTLKKHGDAQLDQVRKDLMKWGPYLSAQVDREIIGEIERLQALAASPSLRQGDFASSSHQAAASLALRQSGNIMLIDREMQQLVNTWVPFGTPMEKAAGSGTYANGARNRQAAGHRPVHRACELVSLCSASSSRWRSRARGSTPSSGRPISMPSQVLSRQMTAARLACGGFRTPRTKSSRGSHQEEHSSGRTCRRRSGIAQPPAAYSNFRR